jgi:hypothetical protein
MNEAAHELVPSLDKNENARVSVRGSVHPGTVIEICRVSFVVPKPVTFVTFRLDRREGRIVMDRFENRETAKPETGGSARKPARPRGTGPTGRRLS